MNTTIELKAALSAIIDQIDRNKRFFLDAEDEEACSIQLFAKRLAAKRDEMKVVLSNHQDDVDKIIGSALDRFHETRKKLVDATNAAGSLPDAYHVKRINELAAALEAFSRIPDHIFEKLKTLTNQP